MVPGPLTPREVPQAFDEVADRYDLMVALSPGYHRQLRASAEVLVLGASTRSPDNDPHRNPPSDPPSDPDGDPPSDPDGGPDGRPVHLRILDLGCGSGASTRAVVDALAAHAPHRSGAALTGTFARIVALDASAARFAAVCLEARGVDAGVGAASPCDRPDRIEHVAPVDVERFGAAAGACELEAVREAVDRDDTRGAEQECALNREQADSAAPEDGDGVALLDRATFGRGEGRRQNVRQEQDGVVR